MKLKDLLKNCLPPDVDISTTGLDKDLEISSITSNSRDVKPGGMFIAVKGLTADGHDYMEQALENGAAAVMAQHNPRNLKNIVRVKDSRRAMAAAAANFYGHPSKDLTLVGITGTNGKTTTTWILESIFTACGYKTGVIGTVNIRYNQQVFNNPVTTPDSIDLQKTLAEMKRAGITHVVMEVSSHGLDLCRVDFCSFDVGVFTNLTQDHLDYHSDIETYFACKKRFFTEFLGPNGKNNAPAVLNLDDPRGKELSRSLGCRTIGVSTKEKADLTVSHITDDIHGLSGTLTLSKETAALFSSLTGTFNLENILCAAGAAHALNIETKHILQGIASCRKVPGRLEKVDSQFDRFMFVDYAHTPDALESILMTLKQRAPHRLIAIFGCGGDRDRSKRPLMGEIAGRISDIAIVTSDNPRKEHPEAIVKDILQGMTGFARLSDTDPVNCPAKKGYLVEVDRRKAIETAVFLSKPGDIIVAAGKGHETYQITNTGTIHFDDREEFIKAAQSFSNRFLPIAWRISDLSDALGAAPVVSTLDPEHLFSGISTDSRTITPTQVFLALKGETFDGHAYIDPLVRKGIQGIVAESGYWNTLDETAKKAFAKTAKVLFEVPNTLTALGQLGRFQRIRSQVKLVAITGSSGKTTTRKITEEIFKTRFHTHATQKNFNNEIGVPLTLLNLSHAHEWAIVEMGMNQPGEISRLSQMACPDIAMVINTAGVHLEGLGSVENVARAKAEIFEGVQDNGTAILFSNDPRRAILEARVKENPAIKTLVQFGPDPHADVQASDIRADADGIHFTARFDDRMTPFTIHSPALFMVDNCLAAICAARAAGIDVDGMQKGIRAFTPVSGRMHLTTLESGLHVIDDTYNANPVSMAQALFTLHRLSRGKKCIAVLGDMLELGAASETLHRQIGEQIARLDISKLYVAGNQVQFLVEQAIQKGYPRDRIFHGTQEAMVEKILADADKDSWILVKGSRGMAMEKVIQGLKQKRTVNF